MVLDTSALLAILELEPEAERFAEAIEADLRRLLSAGSLMEAALVVTARRGAPGGRELDLLLHKARVEIVPATANHAEIGRRAFASFGKGRHAAGLNFGDLFAYALSQDTGEALLFKGSDFARTDVAIHEASAS